MSVFSNLSWSERALLHNYFWRFDPKPRKLTKWEAKLYDIEKAIGVVFLAWLVLSLLFSCF